MLKHTQQYLAKFRRSDNRRFELLYYREKKFRVLEVDVAIEAGTGRNAIIIIFDSVVLELRLEDEHIINYQYATYRLLFKTWFITVLHTK